MRKLLYDPGPLELVTPETEFHCVFGPHEALVHDDNGAYHCDACGMRVTVLDDDAVDNQPKAG